MTEIFRSHNCEFETFDVECFKFSEIFTENRKIDLFILDVEGGELEAIEGILEINRDFYPEIFCIEVNKINLPLLNSMLDPYYTIEKTTIPEGDAVFKRRY